MESTKGRLVATLIQEADNLLYLLIALVLVGLAGYGAMDVAGTKLADMLLGAVLIKVKS